MNEIEKALMLVPGHHPAHDEYKNLLKEKRRLEAFVNSWKQLYEQQKQLSNDYAQAVSNLHCRIEEKDENLLILSKGIRALVNCKAFSIMVKNHLKVKNPSFFTEEQSKEISIALQVADDITDIYEEEEK